MKYLVTGGAGFIGSHIVDRLLERGNKVRVYDNFSTGREAFLSDAKKSSNFTLIHGDLLDSEKLIRSLQRCDFVFHMAANADVRDLVEMRADVPIRAAEELRRDRERHN